jgi:hypothetical protein
VADEAKTHSIAVVGILATALVGIIGSGATWLVARDDRANERSLAHEARVYDRRADAYLAALRLIEQQRLQLEEESSRVNAVRGYRALARNLPTFVMGLGRDGFVYSRVVAFGSSRVVEGYRRLRGIATSAAADEITMIITNVHPSNRLRTAYHDFVAAQRKFQMLVQRELS